MIWGGRGEMEWPMMTERLVSIELRWKWFRCGCAATSAIDKKSDMTQLDIYETCSGDYEVILSFWVPIYSAVTVLWHCSDIARQPHWNCSFSFENLGRFFFFYWNGSESALKLHLICFDIALKLLLDCYWYCPEKAGQLFENGTEVVLELLLNYPETALKRFQNYPETDLELLYNCPL